MSAIITGRVFWTDFSDLSYKNKKHQEVKIKETTAKVVMLAIADSTDDFGENSWQSFQTIARKASIQRRSVIRVVRALMQHNYLKIAGITKYGTNNFSVNIELLGEPPKVRAKIGRPKTSDSETEIGDSDANIGDSETEIGDRESPYPPLNLPDPSSNNGAHAPRTPENPPQRRTDAKVLGDVFDGMQHFAAQGQALAEQTGIEAGVAQAIFDYPVDVRSGVQAMYTHFGIRAIPEKPKSGRGGDFADWIAGVRELQKTAAAYHVDFSYALEVTKKYWTDNRFTVARPGALKKAMSGALAQKEIANGNNRKNSKPDYTPEDLAAAERINARNAERQARMRGV